jgi:glycosyltransferase involved in cell wall biosynthesis
MTDTPVVSAIVPFFNAQRFLGVAIKSVLAQTFGDWELLLVDDGSSDAGSDIARDYANRDRRIRVLQHHGHENRGTSASRNLAFREARGELIAPLDADDIWEPPKLEEQLAIMRSHPAVSVVYGSPLYWRSWDRNRTEGDFTPDPSIPMNRVYAPPELARRSYPLGRSSSPCPSDLLVRKSALERVGGWDEGFKGKLQLYEDQVFLVKLYLHVTFYVSSRRWTKYRLHEQQFSAGLTRSNYWEARAVFLDWLEEYLDGQQIDDRRVRRAVSRAALLARHPAIQRIWHLKSAFWRRPLRRLVSAILRSRTTSSKPC